VIGSDPRITLLAGFDAMRAFLNARWEDGGRQSGDLAILLGGTNRDAAHDGQPADPAQWSDWLDAVLMVRPDLAQAIDAQRPIGVRDGFHAMRAFLTAYWERGDKQERGIGAVLKSLCRPDGVPDPAQWDRWLAAVRAIHAAGQS
jgi:hypothetical protein